MDPRHDADLILGHLEGDLSPEDAAKVQALREADPGFAALLDGMADDRDQLRSAPPAEPPVGLTDMALADLERSMLLDDHPDSVALLPPGRRRMAIAPLLVYGGIAAVLVLTASAVLKSVQPPASSPTIAAAPDAEGFDIAAAPIQAQRDLARRDLAAADLEQSPTDADAPDARLRAGGDASVAAESPPSNSVASTALDDATPLRAESDSIDFAAAEIANATQQAKTSAAAIVADAAPRAEESRSGGAQPAAAFSNDAFGAAPAAPAADLAGGSIAGRRSAALATHESMTLAEADAVAEVVAADAERSSPTAVAERGIAPVTDAPVVAAAPHVAAPSALPVAAPAPLANPIANPAPAAAPPSWLRTVETLGGDWTRWTTLDAPDGDLGLPAGPARP